MTHFTINPDSINKYGNAYMALYEIAKARTEEQERIKIAEASVKTNQENLNMSTTIEQLNERRIALKVAIENRDAARATLDKLVNIQQTSLDAVHAEFDHAEVYEAYKRYALERTEEARIAYIKTFADSFMTFEDDVYPVHAIAEYMYFGLARNNAYKNKFTLKAESKAAFYDKSMRATIDKLVSDGLIDTSKLTFTSKKLAKMEEKAKEKARQDYNNECMNK